MRTEGNTATFGDVTISLAQAYGFCWGVERAVQMAYEARSRYPDAKLFMTNEIIHNPGVNAVCFLPTPPAWWLLIHAPAWQLAEACLQVCWCTDS